MIEELVGDRPGDQGHVVRAEVLQPDRRHLLRGGRPPSWSRCRRRRPDFRLFWDNAYAVHTLTHDVTAPVDVLGPGRGGRQPEPPVGVRVHVQDHLRRAPASASSADRWANIAWYLQHAGKRSIGPDKVNQLRHVRFFGDADGVRPHMQRHQETAGAEVRAGGCRSSRTGSASRRSRPGPSPRAATSSAWTCCPAPRKRTVALAKEAGIAVTEAGAAFPYRKDPEDQNIRIAPTFPSLPDLQAAIDGLATCALLAATESLLARE